MQQKSSSRKERKINWSIDRIKKKERATYGHISCVKHLILSHAIFCIETRAKCINLQPEYNVAQKWLSVADSKSLADWNLEKSARREKGRRQLFLMWFVCISGGATLTALRKVSSPWRVCAVCELRCSSCVAMLSVQKKHSCKCIPFLKFSLHWWSNLLVFCAVSCRSKCQRPQNVTIGKRRGTWQTP